MRFQKILLGAMVGMAGLCAQTTPPDFSGVYYPIAPFGRAAVGRPAGAPQAGAKLGEAAALFPRVEAK